MKSSSFHRDRLKLLNGSEMDENEMSCLQSQNIFFQDSEDESEQAEFYKQCTQIVVDDYDGEKLVSTQLCANGTILFADGTPICVRGSFHGLVVSDRMNMVQLSTTLWLKKKSSGIPNISSARLSFGKSQFNVLALGYGCFRVVSDIYPGGEFRVKVPFLDMEIALDTHKSSLFCQLALFVNDLLTTFFDKDAHQIDHYQDILEKLVLDLSTACSFHVFSATLIAKYCRDLSEQSTVGSLSSVGLILVCVVEGKEFPHFSKLTDLYQPGSVVPVASLPFPVIPCLFRSLQQKYDHRFNLHDDLQHFVNPCAFKQRLQEMVNCGNFGFPAGPRNDDDDDYNYQYVDAFDLTVCNACSQASHTHDTISSSLRSPDVVCSPSFFFVSISHQIIGFDLQWWCG
jgi:hypothetical protein